MEVRRIVRLGERYWKHNRMDVLTDDFSLSVELGQ